MKQANAITKEVGIGIDQGLKAAWSTVRFGNPIRYTKVVGVTYGQSQQVLKGLSETKVRFIVRLKREPHNVHDCNAVAVYAVVGLKNEYKIGYINALRATSLSYEMDAGRNVLVLSAEVTGQGKEYFGMNIKYILI
jgi:hypothetical protein